MTQHAYPTTTPLLDRPAPPPAVLTAVRLMFVSAVMSLVGIVYVLAEKDQIRQAVADANPDAASSTVTSAVNTAVTIAVGIAGVILVLYVLLALQVRKGKNWARIVTVVVSALGIFGSITSLAGTEPALQRVLAVVNGLLALAVVLFLGKGKEYFRR